MSYNHHHAGSLTYLLPAIKRTVFTLRGAAGIEHFSGDQYYHGAFYSEENRLLINLNGAVQLKYGKSSYAVDKNQMAFLKSNTRIEYQVNGGSEAGQVEFIIFSMSYDLVKEFSTVTLLPPVPKTSSHEIVLSNLHPFLLRFAGSVIPYLEDGIRVEEHLVKIKLLELLYSLKTIDGKFLELFLDFRKESRPNITVIVEENFMNALSVKQLARLTGRSLSGFRREFFSVYNMPPSQWIRERRLKKSREFLINTNMSVTDICYTLGFENIAHFSRLFKSQFGQSPTGYRLQLLSA
jgi:AraC-like DNA-binding protein